MTPERWRQLEAVFQAVLDLVPEERGQYLSAVCGEDRSLRSDIEALLRQHESAGNMLEAPQDHSLVCQKLSVMVFGVSGGSRYP